LKQNLDKFEAKFGQNENHACPQTFNPPMAIHQAGFISVHNHVASVCTYRFVDDRLLTDSTAILTYAS